MASRIPTPATQGAQRIGAVQLGEARNPFMNVTAPVEAFGGGDAATGLVSAGKVIMGGVDTLVDAELKDREDASNVRLMELQNAGVDASVKATADMRARGLGNAAGSGQEALDSLDAVLGPLLARMDDPDAHVSPGERVAAERFAASQRAALTATSRAHEREQLHLHLVELSETAQTNARTQAAMNPGSNTAINMALAMSTAAAKQKARAEQLDQSSTDLLVKKSNGAVYVAAITGALDNHQSARAEELLATARHAEALTDEQLIAVEGKVNAKADLDAAEDLFRAHYKKGRPLIEQLDAIAESDASQAVKDAAGGRAKARHAVDEAAEDDLDNDAWDEAVAFMIAGGRVSDLSQAITSRLTDRQLTTLVALPGRVNDLPDDPTLVARVYTSINAMKETPRKSILQYGTAEAAQIGLGALGSNAQRDWIAQQWANATAAAGKATAAAGKAAATAAAAADAWSSDIAANTAINDGLMKFDITSEDPEKYGGMRVRIGAEMDAAIAAGDPINTTTKLNHLIASLQINDLYDMKIEGVPTMLIDDAQRALMAAGYTREEAADRDLIRKTFGRYLSGETDPAEIERILSDPKIVPQKGT